MRTAARARCAVSYVGTNRVYVRGLARHVPIDRVYVLLELSTAAT
jgi:hypothetical protein